MKHEKNNFYEFMSDELTILTIYIYIHTIYVNIFIYMYIYLYTTNIFHKFSHFHPLCKHQGLKTRGWSECDFLVVLSQAHPIALY
jgi:hypothetical protein